MAFIGDIKSINNSNIIALILNIIFSCVLIIFNLLNVIIVKCFTGHIYN